MELEFFASCLGGAEQVLADELKTFGIDRVRPLKGGVAFFCEAASALEACLWSRLASRVALVLGRGAAANADQLYETVAQLAWEDILVAGASFSVRAHGANQELRNTRFTALKAKDAIADRLRQQRPRRDVIENAGADQRVFVDIRLHGCKTTVSLDFCGEALNHRPYLFPDDKQDAPLRVATAAAALALMRWSELALQGCPLVDPVCGDGIMLVEAAATACDLAPSLQREKWGFFGWSGFDAAVWQKMLECAHQRFQVGLERFGVMDSPSQPGVPDAQKTRFVGTSTSSPSIAAARKHGRRAGLRTVLSVERGDATAQGALVARVRQAAHGAQGSCAVACDVGADRRADAAAAVKADEAAVAAACRAAGQECVAAVVDGADVATRFPASARQGFQLGQGRTEVSVEVFRGPAAAGHEIKIIDLDTGQAQAVEVYEATADQFAARLRKVFKERRKQARRAEVSSFRIYDYDLPEYAVAIDWYQGAGDARGNSYLSIAEYAPPSSVDEGRARRRFCDVLTIAPLVCGVRPDHVFAKRRLRAKGGAQYRQNQGRSYVTTVEEGGLLFEVDLAKRLDTGLFLDHRITRDLLRREVGNGDFLNLFAYTGAASVYAAAGGAASTTTVDLSQNYVDWAQRNLAANGFSGSRHQFVKADVLQWVTQARRRRQRFDLIFVDPPTFSNSKAMGKKTWDVQRDHAELLIGVAHLLAPGGQAIFSCNLRTFKPDVQKLTKYGVEIEDITAETIPFDFARTPKIHHCYRVRATKGGA